MVGTIFSLILAVFLYVSEYSKDIPNYGATAIILIVIAALFILIHTLTLVLAWSPMQTAEQHITPRIFDLLMKDHYFRFTNIWLTIFPLLSFAFAMDILSFNIFSKNLVLPLWLVLLGISLDAIHFCLRRVYGYLNPFKLISLFTHEANKCIQNEKEAELCHWIDGLSEIAIKAVQRTSTALCNEVNNELQVITRLFLESSKSISHHTLDTPNTTTGSPDNVSYMLFYILQRLEMVNDKAVEQRLEPASSYLITVLGKIVVSSAKYDLTLTDYPLHFLGRITLKAQNKGLTEVGQKAICTLVEVAKMILTEIDITYLELEESFFTLTSQLDNISKEMFRQDKTMNIKILKQPFLDLKELFTKEKVGSHQDTPAIVRDIDRILAEYDALEAVMRSVPPIPKVVSEAEEK